jgi:hypothetical protein
MSAAASPFLRPTHPHRRRRRSTVLRLAARLGRLLPVVALPMAAWFWMVDGQTFALSAVETEGSPRISPDWIERALEPELGSNLLVLPLDRVRERLEAHPWLGSVEARKELPSVLRVEVEERVAAAVIETEEGLWYVDADGHRIAWLEPDDSAGSLPRIAAGVTVAGISPALATSEAACVRRALAIDHALSAGGGPAWSAAPLWVDVVGDDDFRLHLGRVPFPILVRSQDVERKIGVLDRLLPDIVDRIGVVAEGDLRVEDRVIARPGRPDSAVGLLEGEPVPVEIGETSDTGERSAAVEPDGSNETLDTYDEPGAERAASEVAPAEEAEAIPPEQPKET